LSTRRPFIGGLDSWRPALPDARMNRLAWVSLAALLSAACSGEEEERDEGLCPQVVVFARPPAGGECLAYGTPCDVPEGFVECCGRGIGDCVGAGGGACVDDPTDTCDPQTGGDCPGICQ
jgi:hypothetical protein